MERPLEQHCHDEFCDLQFNCQGLPTKPSAHKTYKQGENIYFWLPAKDSVAWFGTHAGRADLGCGGNPLNLNDELGVLACADGVPR